jgi:hypothetical protein
LESSNNHTIPPMAVVIRTSIDCFVGSTEFLPGLRVLLFW